MRRSRLTVVGNAVALPLLLAVLWWVASADSESIYFPSLQKILGAFPETWLDDGWGSSIIVDGVPSVARLAIGFASAALIAVALGTAIGLHPRLRAFVEPVLELVRAIPGPVLVPVVSLFAGIGDGMKVAVITLGALWPILLNTIDGVRGVDPVMTETARSYHLSRPRRLIALVLPAASPQIFAGMRQGLSVGIILMVISEMFAATNGLGFSVVQFQRNFALPEMWTGIIVLGTLGLLASLVLQFAETRVLRWYTGLRAADHES
ncbi:ABC transporter permease [Microbacterium sp. zg.Y1090]|uniref:ABC transporter permease n=1 Tax=Microbacterium TaxID=33882 RepID=UPI00214BECF9|nr:MULTISPECIES: ABC transporter permease [unclassified Microbacterium]MCR2814012.1 ABC transporter permease [Microbacterium sp. zg.Y1084]MCR2819286.1 ABC transporter permease [Microbacterium sp. zg.Y1090]WIM28268.1 ABC transporter permease [Microbacterium sp. zg-Y1090]